jgi:lipopolysaccharide transport system permease protein
MTNQRLIWCQIGPGSSAHAANIELSNANPFGGSIQPNSAHPPIGTSTSSSAASTNSKSSSASSLTYEIPGRTHPKTDWGLAQQARRLRRRTSLSMPTSSASTAGLAPDPRQFRQEIVIRPPVWSFGRSLRAVAVLADHWDLLYTLTVHRLRVRYKQSLLGIAWAVLQPLATMAVLTGVFSYIARVSTGDVPYAVFALSALVPWTCFASAMTTATQSLVGHAALVTRVYFPREILPLTYVLTAIVDAAIAGALLLVIMAVCGVAPAASAWMVVPIFVVLVTLVTGLSLAASATHVRFRDVGMAMPIALQLLLFTCPIAYSLSSVPREAAGLYLLNPIVGIVENFRRAMLGTGPLHVESLLISVVWAVVLLPLSYAYFKHVEATAADVV